MTFSKTLKQRGEIAKQVFPDLCVQNGLPRPDTEFRFTTKRKWRMDYAWPKYMVGLEVDGGTWSGGRHTRGSGWEKDTEKLNNAASMGWRMLRCTPQTLCSPEMIETIRLTLEHSEAA